MNKILEAILLGIIQGLTEFLPISSTAHLTLAGKLMGLIEPLHPEHWTASIAVIQLGTLAAVFIYFIKDISKIIRGFLTGISNRLVKKDDNPFVKEGRTGWLIFIGTIPVVLVGLLFKKSIEGSFTKNLYVIAGSMFTLAIILWLAEIIGKRKKEMEQVSFLDSFIIGFAQAFALIPGSSRSGTTITAGLFIGLKRETAAKFSFLLSLPSVLASGLLELVQSLKEIPDSPIGPAELITATFVAGIVGYASIWALLKYLKNHSTLVFVIYRIALGLTILILLYTNLISN